LTHLLRLERHDGIVDRRRLATNNDASWTIYGCDANRPLRCTSDDVFHDVERRLRRRHRANAGRDGRHRATARPRERNGVF
jgi:hypothetical protein